MFKQAIVAVLVAGLGLASVSCKKQPEAPAASQPKIGDTHSALGVIKSFGEGNKSVVIEHEAFKDGFMEAMTMSFELKSADLAKGLKAGDKVEFTMTYEGNAFPITVITKIKS